VAVRALSKLTWVQTKLYLREPVGAFFTLLFAPLVLILFGFIYGNDPVQMLDGRGWMDVTVPAYVGLIIGTVGLMGVPIATAAAREKGVLRRFHASPLRPLTYLVADVTVYLGMTLLGIVLLFLVGRIAYNIHIDGNLISLLAGICLGAFSFMALGYLLAGVAPTARVAQVVGMVLFYPMMFLSGAAVPLEVMPEGVRNVARFLPLYHVVTLVKGLWFGDGWGKHLVAVGVLGGMLIVGTALSARLFRWD
jgi:ABC-2 type transport system permease protein